jgi:geranylgeranyl reductase family protein
MITCDVLIVGGGPAGSTCAWKLRQAGFDAVVLDRAIFPREKVCGGWITPQVVADLRLDVEDYRRGRIFQPITGFRTGTIGGRREIETSYKSSVSFGIRRREFDDYLLRRSGATVKSGTPIETIRREDERWIVNEAIAAPMLVGAGGHFCPVARLLNRDFDAAADAPLVVAQEVEFAVDSSAAYTTAPEMPELYFCPDLKGYGWCFRKGNYINIGFGRADRHSLPKATAEFIAFLEDRNKIPRLASWRWRGHAYLLHDDIHRRVVDNGVLLVGDAAGLAYPQSGEGIRPAIESGLLAAEVIADTHGRYTRDRLDCYETRLRARFGTSRGARAVSSIVSAWTWTSLTTTLLGMPGFVRHMVLDRWFLHAHEAPLTAA